MVEQKAKAVLTFLYQGESNWLKKTLYTIPHRTVKDDGEGTITLVNIIDMGIKPPALVPIFTRYDLVTDSHVAVDQAYIDQMQRSLNEQSEKLRAIQAVLRGTSGL